MNFPTLGILGGGQLGKMMALAALRMGIGIKFLAPKNAGPMQGLGTQTVGDWKDPDVLRAFAKGCRAVTVESEWAPADEMSEVLRELPETEAAALWPEPATLSLIRHKGIQNDTLRDAGLPLPPYRRCETRDETRAAAEEFGYPVMLKQYRGSYDGYGNATVENDSELNKGWEDLADDDGLLVEDFIDFRRELSVIVARRPDGDHRVYPVALTVQQDHRCHAVIVPAPISRVVAQKACDVGLAAVQAVNGIGITAVELFETNSGEILVNELAPRPHNTGHYSIEGCHTSQFENHVRAVLDLPLGSIDLRAPYAVMVNVLGGREGEASSGNLSNALAVPDAGIHIYGKPQVRPNRKMGHVTLTGDNPDQLLERAEKAAAVLRL